VAKAKSQKITVECLYANGMYPKIVHPRDKERPANGPREYLRFSNHFTVVDADFFEVIKEAEGYGVEFAQQGMLHGRRTRSRVKVVQGAISSAGAPISNIVEPNETEGEISDETQ